MALVPFPGAAKPAPDDDDDRHIHLTDPDVLEDAGAKMSFLDHLDELRKRLIACVWGLVIGCAIAFLFVGRIQSFIWMPLYNDLQNTSGVKFMYTSGFEPFMLTMKIGALAGLMLSVPFILYQLWLFIAPGLYSHEKRMAAPFVIFCTTFFALGAAFSHFVAFPWTWKFFLGWHGVPAVDRGSVRAVRQDAARIRADLSDADDRVFPGAAWPRVGWFPPPTHEVRGSHHLHHRRGDQPGHRRRLPVFDGGSHARTVRTEHRRRLGVCQTAQYRVGSRTGETRNVYRTLVRLTLKV
jgi:hypothetical protein